MSGLSYDHWAMDDKVLEQVRLTLEAIKKEKHAMVRGQRCRRLKDKANKIQNSEKRDLAMKEINEVMGDD